MRKFLQGIVICLVFPFIGLSQVNQMNEPIFDVDLSNFEETEDIYSERANTLDNELLIATRLDRKILGNWRHKDSSYYVYEGDKKTELISMIYVGEEWRVTGKKRYVYDEEGNLSMRVTLSKSSGEWEDRWRSVVTYNSHGKLIESIYQGMENGHWTNRTLLGSDRNEDNLIVKRFTKEWDGMDWVDIQQIIYEYNQDFEIIYTKMQLWDNDGWENKSDETVLYPNSLEKVTIDRRWDEVELLWENLYRETQTTNEGGTASITIDDIWSDEMWEPRYLVGREYNEDNLEIRRFHKDWDGTNWVYDRQYITTYSSGINYISVFQEWTDQIWVNKNRNIRDFTSGGNVLNIFTEYWSEDTEEWIRQQRYYYFYDLFTDLKELPVASTDLLVHPNPSEGEINLEFLNDVNETDIHVFNTQGQLVHQERLDVVRRNKIIDLSNLSEGTYFLKLNTGKRSIIEKIIIIH